MEEIRESVCTWQNEIFGRTDIVFELFMKNTKRKINPVLIPIYIMYL